MKTRDQIIAENPLEPYLRSRGFELKRHGAELSMKCPFHSPDNHPSFMVNTRKNLWMCGPCGLKGSVIDLVMHLDKVSVAEAMKILANEPEPIYTPPKEQKIVETYVYNDPAGKPRFRVHRIEPGDKGSGKKFSQERYDNGEWVKGMAGVERILYRITEVMLCDTVWIVEGERKADWLARLGICATSCVGGAGGWSAAYADSLKDKHVVICRDNDEPGDKWEKLVHESLVGKVASVRFVRIPKHLNDVVDYIREVGDDSRAGDQLMAWFNSAPILTRGIDLPIYGVSELKQRYKAFVENSKKRSIHLHRWLPSLRGEVRALFPGEMVSVLADTGVGKSAILQNIAHTLNDLTVLFFELELPDALMTERFSALDSGIPCNEIEDKVGQGEDLNPEGLNHIWVCPESHMSTDKIEEYIVRSELKIGKKPDVVMVDYIGLIRGGFGKRYERVSSIAEELKVIAKSTGVVLFVASQIHRKDEQGNEASSVNLHDAKDSGSIENSSGLVLGAWREDFDTMIIKVLKSTKGGAGLKIKCNFSGPTMRITERIEVHDFQDK